MRFLIIGAGAIGCWVGAKLALSGAEVTLVGRARPVARINERGIILSQGDAVAVARDLCVTSSIAEALALSRAYDAILLAVKSYDTEAVIAEMERAAIALPPILSLQNGIGNEELLAAAFGSDRVLAGAITTPVTSPEPGVVEAHKAGGVIAMAPLVAKSAKPAPMAMSLIPEALAIFHRAGFRAIAASDWRALKWSKLLLNILGNATSAILDWTPRQVFADSRMAVLEVKALREALAVMRAQGIAPIRLGNYPVPLLAWAGRIWPTPLVRFTLGRLVAGGRGGKRPSLHLDLSAGKGKSEVTYLNGAVAHKGAELGIPTPVNRGLTDILVSLTRGDAPWDHYRDRPERLLAAMP
jgi:2-dehydropantoate 2-reductase